MIRLKLVNGRIAFLLFLILIAGQVRAGTLTVMNTGDSGAGSLRGHIGAASAGDVIQFNASVTGTVVLTSGELLIDNDITIQGPGPQILAVSGSSSSRVFKVNSGRTVAISGLTIRDGRTSNGVNGVSSAGSNGVDGAGIYNSGSLSLSNCIVQGHVTGNGGNGSAGVSASGKAGGSGGRGSGIYNDGALVLSFCSVSGNRTGAGGSGGAGDVSGGFSGGDGGAGGSGAGVYNSGGSCVLNCSTISGNTNGAGGNGGFAFNGGNGGHGGSGGAVYSTNTLTVSTCTFSGNTSGYGGSGGSGTNGGVGGNGGFGAGICNVGNMSLYWSTVCINSNAIGGTGLVVGVAGKGGGVYNSGSATVFDTLLASNVTVGLGRDVFGSFASDGNNLVSVTNNSTGFSAASWDILGSSAVPVDANLGPLTNNGGLTFTHALTSPSPAIDAGNATNAPATDQRGSVRVSGIGIDIGAYETPTMRYLQVRSAVGTVIPPPGTNYYISGTVIPCYSGSPVLSGTSTQYVCIGWNGTGNVPSAGSGTNLVVTNNLNSLLTWNWKTQYLISVVAGTNGTVTPTNSWLNRGANQTFSFTPDPGYHVASVVIDSISIGATNSYTFTNISAGHTVAVQFTNTWNFTVNSAYGSTAPGTGTAVYTNGSAVICSLSGSPISLGNGTQRVCSGWTGSGSVPVSGTGTSVSVTITNDSVITWNWKTQCWLATSAGANGSVLPVSGWFDTGSQVVVTATGNLLYRFDAWTGDYPGGQAGVNPITVTMDRTKSVSASFVLNGYFVSASGSHTAPFDTWAKASTNIQAAVQAATTPGAIILVSNGIYNLSSTIIMTNGATLVSVNGPGSTIIDGRGLYQCFNLSKSNTTVQGFTIRNGSNSAGNGGGVSMGVGTVLSGCVVISNTAVWGGGVFCDAGGIVRNCLIVKNDVLPGYVDGSGLVCSSGGKVINCTIADNRVGGLVCDGGGYAQNSIIYSNATGNYNNYGMGVLSNCCVSPLVSGGNNVSGSPLFANYAAGDFHLSAGSPCIDAGLTAGAPTNDLDGALRPQDGDGNSIAAMDIGAYEFSNASLDSDHDGMSDQSELIAGTNPYDSNSVFEITNAVVQTTGSFVLNWPSVTGHYYTVKSSTNLLSSASWINAPTFTDVLGTGAMLSYTASVSTVNCAYKVTVH